MTTTPIEPRYTITDWGRQALTSVDWYGTYASPHAPLAEQRVLIYYLYRKMTFDELQEWTSIVFHYDRGYSPMVKTALRYVHDHTQAVIDTLVAKAWLQTEPPTVTDALAALHMTSA